MYFKRNPLAVSVGALLCAGFSTVALAQWTGQPFVDTRTP